MFKDFISKSKEHKKLGQRMIDALKALIAKIKKNLSRSGIQDGYISKVENALQLWEQAYQSGKDVVEISPAQKSTGDVKAKNSIDKSTSEQYDYSKPFAQQVDDWISGKFPSRDSLVVSETPEIWRMIGLNALPVTINQTHVDYAINGTKDSDHYLTKQGLLQLPEAIKHPVAIISSKTQNGTSLIAMLDIRQNGKQVIVPVVIDGFAQQNNLVIDSNAITSVYGKKYSISNVLYNALNDEANGKAFSVYYVDTEKATALLQKAKVPMPKGSAISANGFVHSIDETGSPVNKKFSNQTETQQFKRWFGKSKVVNKDGTPKVMYRGDSADFTVFDRKKSKGSNLYGRGFYFTDSDSHAGQYGNTRAFYLSIQNPVSTKNTTITKTQIQKFLEAVAKNEDYSFENYGYEATVESVLKSVYGKSDFAMLYDISLTAIGDAVEAVELFNQINGTKFDGFILDTETVAFYPSQIKSATDNIGTFDRNNPDINYSIDGMESIVSENLEKARKQYGEIPKGENPARDVRVPRKSSEGQNVSYTIRTALEAGVTPDVLVPKIEEKVIQGDFSDETHANKKTPCQSKRVARRL